MRTAIITLASIAILFSTVGCANGPVRNFLRNTICNDGCQAPPLEPAFGFGFDSASGNCATGECGLVNGSSANPGTTSSYANDSFIQGDPYISGSNNRGATINPPVFDVNSGPTYGSTIVPPANSGSLPTPAGSQFRQ